MQINNIATQHLKTTGGVVHEGPVLFFGFLIGSDAVNDPTITLYDNVKASGKELVPTNQYDASVLGLNGAMPGAGVLCASGIYADISCAGACEITVYFTPHFQ